MNRKDYDKIKQIAQRFVKDWENRNTKDLKDYIHDDVKFYVSTCKDYTDGGRHALNGVSGFIAEQKDVSYIRMDLYNFLASANDEKGRFTGIVCGTAAAQGEWKTCQFTFNIAAKLSKHGEEWYLDEIRMDLCDLSGDFTEYYENWYMEENKSHYFAGIHLPMISGELDGVDYPSKSDETILSDEEQIQAVFSRYAFGMDHKAFSYMEEVLAEDVLINMAPFGTMDKRGALQSLKLHRGLSKYWTHPGMIESVCIHDNEADVRLWRMAGHRQRSNPLILTEENILYRHACARYEIKMKKENGRWKLSREDYYLGIVEIDHE